MRYACRLNVLAFVLFACAPFCQAAAARARTVPVPAPVGTQPIAPERLLAAVSARYGTDPALQAVPDLGEGDYGEVRSGIMPARVPLALGTRLPVRPGDPVAIKILYLDPGGMAIHEAAVSRRLEDAGGAALFVRVTHDSELGVLVMEKLKDYRPLDAWAEERAIGRQVFQRIASQLERGLVVLERAGLVHSDLRPDNVMVGPGGRVRIVDFGITAELGAYPPYPGYEGWRGGDYRYISDNQLRNGPAAFGDDRHAVKALLRGLKPR